MKNQIKKFLGIILAACLVIGSVGAVKVSADDGVIYGSWNGSMLWDVLEFHTPYIIDNKEATCTEAGYITYGCSNRFGVLGLIGCDATKTDVYPAKGHSYGEAVVTEATCTVSGSSVITCTACEDTVETEIPATGHSYGEPVVTEATCTVSGSSVITCADCEDTVETEIPAKGHSFGEVVECTVDGVSGKGQICENCGLISGFVADTPAIEIPEQPIIIVIPEVTPEPEEEIVEIEEIETPEGTADEEEFAEDVTEDETAEDTAFEAEEAVEETEDTVEEAAGEENEETAETEEATEENEEAEEIVEIEETETAQGDAEDTLPKTGAVSLGFYGIGAALVAAGTAVLKRKENDAE